MKKVIIGIIVILILIFSVNYFTENEKVSDNGLKIGMIAPLSGDFAGVGQNVVNGASLAAKHYSENNNIVVDLIVEDDSADATKGLSAFNKLTQVDKTDGLVNVFTSTMDAIYDASEVLPYPVMMTFFQANNVADDHVFQTTPGNDGTWTGYANYLKSSVFNMDNLVVVHSPDAAQTSFAEAFVGAYGTSGVTVFETVLDKNSLRTDATKIASLKPTTVLFIMTPEAGAILTKELLVQTEGQEIDLLYDIQLVTGIDFYTEQLGGLDKINGSIGLSLEGNLSDKFKTDYNLMFGEDPGFLAEYGYDTMLTYLESYNEEESVWTSNLKKTKKDGESGYFAFDDKGIRLPDLAVKEIQNGELVTIDRITVK